MKIKVAELEGAQLDMWVAKALGWKIVKWSMRRGERKVWVLKNDENQFRCNFNEWNPSTAWSQAGPIIESERICIRGPGPMGGYSPEFEWTTYIDTGSYAGGGFTGNGRTPLIAAMRCFVASRFGEEVEEA